MRPIALVVLAAALVTTGRQSARLTRPLTTPQNASVTGGAPSRVCLDAAKNALGPKAVVLACGHLTGAAALEVVAALRLSQFRTNRDGVPVSKFVILRRAGSRWSSELTADNYPPRNSIGYIGIDFIDDSQPVFGYRVLLADRRYDSSPGFTIELHYLSRAGRNEGITTQISWNPKVGRFQEYAYGEDPEGFRPELKNPPHIGARCCSH